MWIHIVVNRRPDEVGGLGLIVDFDERLYTEQEHRVASAQMPRLPLLRPSAADAGADDGHLETS